MAAVLTAKAHVYLHTPLQFGLKNCDNLFKLKLLILLYCKIFLLLNCIYASNTGKHLTVLLLWFFF